MSGIKDLNLFDGRHAESFRERRRTFSSAVRWTFAEPAHSLLLTSRRHCAGCLPTAPGSISGESTKPRALVADAARQDRVKPIHRRSDTTRPSTSCIPLPASGRVCSPRGGERADGALARVRRALALMLAVVVLVACGWDVTSPTSFHSAGDLTTAVLIGAGDIAACGSKGTDATAKLLDSLQGPSLPPGTTLTPLARRVIFSTATSRRGAATRREPGRLPVITTTIHRGRFRISITSESAPAPPDVATTPIAKGTGRSSP
jgi:hypothetical protein